MILCMYGASANGGLKEDEKTVYLKMTAELGTKIAQRGHTLVFGGGATGLMGVAASAVLACKGNVIGIAPDFLRKDGMLLEKCTEFIYTKTMRERKQKMEEISDAFIMVPGGIGTLEEFFEILTLKQLKQHNKPIAILNICGYFNPMLAMLGKAVNEKFLYPENLLLFRVCSDVSEVLDFVENGLSEKLNG